VGFFDGQGQRPHPEDPAALRARLREDFQANVRLGEDAGVVRGWLWARLRRPFRAASRLVRGLIGRSS